MSAGALFAAPGMVHEKCPFDTEVFSLWNGHPDLGVASRRKAVDGRIEPRKSTQAKFSSEMMQKEPYKHRTYKSKIGIASDGAGAEKAR